MVSLTLPDPFFDLSYAGEESENRHFNANEIFTALSVESGFDSRRINLDIQFQINAAVLTDQARAQLSELATALKRSGISEDIFEVAGHTDSSGSMQHNLQLSLQRAAAVRHYLNQLHGIVASKLVATGYGERFPRAGREATDPLNRRVEIINHGRWATAEEIRQQAQDKVSGETSSKKNLNDLF